jgi:hypothetical protein
MELLWADGAYTRGFREWVEEERGWRVEVPHHRDRQLWRYGLEEKPRGLLVVPRRWVVEENIRVAWASAEASQRLRASAGERGGDDTVGYEPHHGGAQARQSGALKCLVGGIGRRLPDLLQNSLSRETV